MRQIPDKLIIRQATKPATNWEGADMKIKVHNLNEAKTLLRESNENYTLPEADLVFESHDGQRLGEAAWDSLECQHQMK
jgi:hypothetical protein